jgi:hypothetical protein
MPKRIVVVLSEAQRQELQQVRDHHPKAYLRERSAAILKVASGHSLTQVGETGLHKRHEPETVHGWIKRYLQQGLDGLRFKVGSGRKPKFFPSAGKHRSGSGH